MTFYPLQFVLLADVGEVIGAILALLVPLIWVVKQIAEAAKQAKQQAVPQPAVPQPAAPQPAQPQGMNAAGQQADPLRNQVEEFLRRAGRGQQADQARAGGRQDIELLIDEEPPTPQRRPLAEPLRPAENRPQISPQPIQQITKPTAPSGPTLNQPPQRRSVVPRKRKTLAERAVERNEERTRGLADQASHLGQRIVQEDQHFDAQLKAKFDHTVGSLAGRSTSVQEVAPAPNDSPAGQIAAMLASPDGVRQAIILNEILRRPSDRW